MCTNVVIENEKGDQLLDLQDSYIPAKADAPAGTKLCTVSEFKCQKAADGRPTVNMLLSSFFLCMSSFSSHLSGRQNSAASPKVPLCRLTTYGLPPTAVPSGMKCWRIVMPPLGTTRSNGSAKGGCMRMPSRTQASRYGRLRTSLYVGKGHETFADRSSLYSLSRVCG